MIDNYAVSMGNIRRHGYNHVIERGMQASERTQTGSIKTGNGKGVSCPMKIKTIFQPAEMAYRRQRSKCAPRIASHPYFENKQGNVVIELIFIIARYISGYIPITVVESSSGVAGMAVAPAENRVVRLKPQACQTERSA